jgi:TPR repeat protein
MPAAPTRKLWNFIGHWPTLDISKAAEQGYAPAQFNLGLMNANGQGTPKDDSEAVNWFRKAAEQGFAAAQNNLGLMYAKGRSVREDKVQAHMWLNLAAAGNAGSAVIGEPGSSAGRSTLSNLIRRCPIAN